MDEARWILEKAIQMQALAKLAMNVDAVESWDRVIRKLREHLADVWREENYRAYGEQDDTDQRPKGW